MSFKDLTTNYNFLSPNNHRFVISRLPNTTLFLQKIELPTVKIGEISVGNPFIALNYSASSLEFGTLDIEFKVDEDLVNYREIFDWMTGLGFPESYKQYNDVKYRDGNKGLRSDASLLIVKSQNIANKEILFRDIFPMSLSGIASTTVSDDVNYMTASVKFSIRDYTINDVSVECG
jgi:hypothetical protein